MDHTELAYSRMSLDKGQVSERFDPSCVNLEVSSLKPLCSAGVTTHVVDVFITSCVFLDNDTQVQ